jgi:hypothetical protein
MKIYITKCVPNPVSTFRGEHHEMTVKLKKNKDLVEVYRTSLGSFFQNIFLSLCVFMLGGVFLYVELKEDDFELFSLAPLIGGFLALIAFLHALQTCFKLLDVSLKTKLFIATIQGVNYSKYANEEKFEYIPWSNVDLVVFAKKVKIKNAGSITYSNWIVLLRTISNDVNIADNQNELICPQGRKYLFISVIPGSMFPRLYLALKKMKLKYLTFETKESTSF